MKEGKRVWVRPGRLGSRSQSWRKEGLWAQWTPKPKGWKCRKYWVWGVGGLVVNMCLGAGVEWKRARESLDFVSHLWFSRVRKWKPLLNPLRWSDVPIVSANLCLESGECISGQQRWIVRQCLLGAVKPQHVWLVMSVLEPNGHAAHGLCFCVRFPKHQKSTIKRSCLFSISCSHPRWLWCPHWRFKT